MIGANMSEEEVTEYKKKNKRKPDYKTRMAIKEREQEMRDEAMKKAEEANIVPTDVTISYDQWWMKVSKKVKLRYQDKEVILVDFLARGLSKKETEEAYDNALRLFGINW